MLCVTGTEPTTASLSARFIATEKRHPGAMLQEVRLDCLDALDDQIFALIKQHAKHTIACCRAPRQGGHFEGAESDRIELLKRASATGARYIDVEADVDADAITDIPKDRLLLSHHDFESIPADLEARLTAMADRKAAVVKLAARVDYADDLLPLKRAGSKLTSKTVLIGMGPAGLLSRTHYHGFGSAWTYVAAGAEQTTAPGQIDLDTAIAMGLPADAQSPLYGLLGGQQVLHSPGPTVYNALFRQLGLAGSYLPIISRSLTATLPLLSELNARGLSVTMPLKAEALALAKPDAIAQQTRAVNSLRRDGDHWTGTNTDVEGIRAPLAQTAANRSDVDSALILGAGGAARAALVAARSLGFKTVVAARRLEQAQQAAADEGQAIAWERRAERPCSILINATPLGGEHSPWPDETPLNQAIVFDLAMSNAPSKLLKRAKLEACATLNASQMWIHQGAAQMRFFLEREIRPEMLEQLLP